MLYPTTDEVKAAVLTTDVSWYVDTVKLWKQKFYTKKWNKLNDSQKFASLTILIDLISAISINQIVKTQLGSEYSFNPSKNIITLGPSPSIISTLHELGHSIWGPNEIDACRFSVAIFQQVFPMEFSKLEWKGHMLVRKENVNY